VHFETISHCLLRRADLREAVDRAAARDRVRIPGDGETVEYA
jgi:hypothetical protein